MTPPEDLPPSAEELAELAQLRQQTENLLAQMDTLLKAGEAANALAEGLYEDMGVEPGIGQRALLANNIPPGDRHLYTTLLTEYENIEESVLNIETRINPPSPRSAGARAVGSRYRI